MQPHHAIVTHSAGSGELFLQCKDGADTLVNGKQLQPDEKRLINHKDRVKFGESQLFFYVDPSKGGLEAGPFIDYAMAQREINAASGMAVAFDSSRTGREAELAELMFKLLPMLSQANKIS